MRPHLNHPHQPALNTLAGLTIAALLATVAIWGFSVVGFVDPVLLWISCIFLILFGLMLFIIWILGIRQNQRAGSFLESDRVLVSWTYSKAEWQQLKEAGWQESKDDWKVQFGCLAFLLALAGGLTGTMLGWGEGLPDVAVSGLAGLILGGLVGSGLGLLVAGSNYWSARQDYRNPEPARVALGVNEIYASDDYFKGDGSTSYIRSARLQRGAKSALELQLVVPPRPRMPTEEQWIIPLPPEWVDRVQEILPLLPGRADAHTNEPWEG